MGWSEKQFCEHDSGVASSTKTGLAGQASKNWFGRASVFIGLCIPAVFLAACGGHVAEGKDCPASVRTSTISGYCIPRYVSLKRDTVSARAGPGTDYPILWQYKAKGLPVQVIGETLDWRRVCDPDRGAVWVHKLMIDGRRSVQTLGGALTPLRRKPGADAPVIGMLNPRSLANLDQCQGDWCKVSIDGARGWLAANRVWGVAAAPQCR